LSRKSKKVVEDTKPGVPAYIVTFSDMVTLLLTFFVMLLSLANTQSTIRFKQGQEAFIRSIKQFGLGMLYGQRSRPDMGHIKERFYVSEPDKSYSGRMISAKEEETQQIFKKIKKNTETMRSQIVASKTNFSVTDIHFSVGDSTLDDSAKIFLGQFCADIQSRPDSKSVKVCVLGIGNDETDEKSQWILSAQRAKAVADFMQDILPSGSKWPIYSWGVGPGDRWTGQNNSNSKQSHILMTILRSDG